MNLKYPSEASWKTIDRYVQRDRQENAWFWEKIDARPFTCESLDQLLSIELNIKFKKLNNVYGYACSSDRDGIPRKEGLLLIHNLLRPYNRDKTIFHELMHIWHGYPLDDDPGVRTSELAKKNTARVEWLSRQARADAELLRHTITKLEIQPWIYDKASYDALSKSCKNPGTRENYCTTRMD